MWNMSYTTGGNSWKKRPSTTQELLDVNPTSSNLRTSLHQPIFFSFSRINRVRLWAFQARRSQNLGVNLVTAFDIQPKQWHVSTTLFSQAMPTG
jgi:hypothetical protein